MRIEKDFGLRVEVLLEHDLDFVVEDAGELASGVGGSGIDRAGAS
jgi:hypothetical protein